jgi:osmotically-inducible protein OsmY
MALAFFAVVPRNPTRSVPVIHAFPLVRPCLGACVLLLALATASCGRPDDAVVADVSARLTADPALRGASISVAAKKGIVLLRGDVATIGQTSQAAATASGVAGVRKVINQLELSDESIRQSVEQKLRADALLADVPIQVDVLDGVVRLRSNATNGDHRLRAVGIARELPGVDHVEDEMK